MDPAVANREGRGSDDDDNDDDDDDDDADDDEWYGDVVGEARKVASLFSHSSFGACVSGAAVAAMDPRCWFCQMPCASGAAVAAMEPCCTPLPVAAAAAAAAGAGAAGLAAGAARVVGAARLVPVLLALLLLLLLQQLLQVLSAHLCHLAEPPVLLSAPGLHLSGSPVLLCTCLGRLCQHQVSLQVFYSSLLVVCLRLCLQLSPLVLAVGSHRLSWSLRQRTRPLLQRAAQS